MADAPRTRLAITAPRSSRRSNLGMTAVLSRVLPPGPRGGEHLNGQGVRQQWSGRPPRKRLLRLSVVRPLYDRAAPGEDVRVGRPECRAHELDDLEGPPPDSKSKNGSHDADRRRYPGRHLKVAASRTSQCPRQIGDDCGQIRGVDCLCPMRGRVAGTGARRRRGRHVEINVESAEELAPRHPAAIEKCVGLARFLAGRDA